jgi:PTH2 family peptidyl-tRNA hydrolase
MRRQAVKQVIVIRKDLRMRRGKEIAQGAHASIAFLLSRLEEARMKLPETYIKYGDFQFWNFLDIDTEVQDWMSGGQAKITLIVNSEEELMDIHDKAIAAGLEVHLITDSGKTEFNGVPTKTCLAIGPDTVDKIDAVTGHLKLY